MKQGKNIACVFRELRFWALFLAVLFPFPSTLPPASGAITPTINYQGFLLSKLTNLPLETPQNLKFKIFDSLSGGTELFSETRLNVRMNKGRYDVEIGSTTSGGLPLELFTYHNNGLWLEIQVGSGGGYEAMSPRVRLQASPYAFNSLYASIASEATMYFKADVISATPETRNGAITISTNLFVMGGISVGDITPGQKLSVAGLVESKGDWWGGCGNPPNYTCGFRFPDGSTQVKAAALTMWDILGNNLFTINAGNTNIGGGLTVPQARLHISSGPGDTGNLLLVSTGTGVDQSPLFFVNGLGEVHGGSYFGDGTTLTGIVRKAGDAITGHLAVSSLTVTSALGLSSPKIKLLENVELSSAPASAYGGIRVSTHIWLSGASKIYGDGSGLDNVRSTDTTKVLKSGDIMTGPLAVTTLTVTGNVFSVSGATFSVLDGNTAVGDASYRARLTVTGGMIATSSITAEGGIYAPSGLVSGARGSFTQSVDTFLVRASSGTFDIFGPSQYSVETASGVWVKGGVVLAPKFIGDGSLLTNVRGTDDTRVSTSGATMTGSLFISGSSLAVAAYGDYQYALTVASASSVNSYSLAVTTAGYVGVQVSNPSAPLEVNSRIMVSNSAEGPAQLHLIANNGQNYIRWSDSGYGLSVDNSLGALGYPQLSRDLVYRTMGSNPAAGGSEVFRVASDDAAYWKFGIGTNSPAERFHVGVNLLVSSSAANSILYVSTATGNVSIRTTAQAHALTVNGGIMAVSSITARGGYYGNQSGIVTITGSDIYLNGNTGIGTNASPTAGLQVAEIPGATYTLAVGTHPDVTNPPFNTYDFVVTPQGRVGIGLANTGLEPANNLQVMNSIRIGAEGYGDQEASLSLRPIGGPAYISWSEAAASYQTKGVLGFEGSSNDLVYRAGASNISGGFEVFRIAVPPDLNFSNWKFGIGTSNPLEKFHVAASVLISTSANAPILYVSTTSGYTGVGTGVPQAKLDVNGLAVFRSSLSVSGAGLAGIQSALEVIGSTLVVRNDGKVGIGVAAPAERLEVAGKVKAAGFAASRAIETAVCNGAPTCTASCVTGEVMGGGCSYTVGTDSMTATYPFSDTAWRCDYSGATGNITAYAICSTVE